MNLGRLDVFCEYQFFSWNRAIIFLYMCCAVFSHIQLFPTPWSVARQAPLSVGILQAMILEWVAIPISRGSSQPRDQTQVSCTAGGFFTNWLPGSLFSYILRGKWDNLKESSLRLFPMCVSHLCVSFLLCGHTLAFSSLINCRDSGNTWSPNPSHVSQI